MIYESDVIPYRENYGREVERVRAWHSTFNACVGALVCAKGHEDGIMAATEVADDTHGPLVLETPKPYAGADEPTA